LPVNATVAIAVGNGDRRQTDDVHGKISSGLKVFTDSTMPEGWSMSSIMYRPGFTSLREGRRRLTSS
jgi:hypothetical protein